ncbi:MAG TPA: ribosome recycling factor [Bacteroidia bacterium]|jgi:ribosome recycling factor|nr:ribosome recycling factor [Bacteroidia bacterium]
MNEDLQLIIDTSEEAMQHALSHLETELVKVRGGRANAGMLDGIMVDYYGTNTPLTQVANVNTPDARTISVQPWEKSMLDPIMRAIQAANLGFNPTNNGTMLICSIPPMTEERRKSLVKKAKEEGENAKVSIRTARRDANEEVKKLAKAGLPEDEGKEAEAKIQQITDAYISKVDKHLEAKEKEIMTV